MTEALLSERRLVRNVAWNLTGAGIPLLVAAWAIPRLVADLGPERFGLLALIWAGVGYFSLFDMGFGRALTKLVAQRLGQGRLDEVAPLVKTALATLAVIGIAVGVCLAALAPWVAERLLSVPPALRHEATVSFAIAALTLPVVVSTAGLIGVLQAHQRFAPLSLVQMTLGVATFAAPLAALQVSPSLVSVTLVLSLSRAVAWTAYWLLCANTFRGKPSAPAAAGSLRRELFRFGGWVTVSNVLGPMMVYLDRFLIAALITMTAVTYYTTPYEMVTRLWVLGDGLVAVVFPAVATALACSAAHAHLLFVRAMRAMTLMMIVPVALILLFATELLTVWVGTEFAAKSSLVLSWLAVGVFLNAVARLPFAVLQASGRPDVTAKLHLVELPLYLGVLWLLVTDFGIVGAAIAWTMRIAIDAVLLFACAFRFIPEIRAAAWRVIGSVCGSVTLLGFCTSMHNLWPRTLAATLLVGAASYYFFLDLRAVLTRRAPVAVS